MIIRIIDGVQHGQFQDRAQYYGERRSLLGKIVMPITKRLRANQVLRHMQPGRRHLDIGCGDGFFLKLSPCAERYGLDELYGEKFEGQLDFEDGFFDYVTMLAVVEHLDDVPTAFGEVRRVLKPGGLFILTTPKQQADSILRVVAKEVEHIHQQYFDRYNLPALAGEGFTLAQYNTFLLGLNQLFVFRAR